MKRPILLAAILLISARIPVYSQQQGEPILAITGATVVDGTGAEPFPATVLIGGERIIAVGREVQIPSGARVVRAEGHTLIPGLFDLHTHLPYATARGVAGDWPKNLKAYLYCGVTSVVDFGTYPETFEPMRRLLEKRIIEGPRISLAARMTTPGGHGAEGGRADLFTLEVLTPREARAAVRRVLSYRPDAIKVFTDGWRYGVSPDMTSMTLETLSAIVDEAHRNGVEVLTHTVTLEGAKIAARAGVDVIAHGIGNAAADEELIQLMKSKGTTYAPTLAVYEIRERNILSPILAAVLEPFVREAIRPPLTAPSTDDETPEARPMGELPERTDSDGEESPRERRWENLMLNTSALREGDIKFGVGTDAGVTGTHHGWATLRELQLLVEGGLSPLEAITAATGNSAKALRVDDERGTIAPGKLADVVLIEGEPHRKMSDIERIRRVFLGGREIDRDRLAGEIASSEPSPIPAIRAAQKIDDFERADGRSRIGTLWVNGTDSGHDHSRMVFGRTLRGGRNHALSVMAYMAEKERPFVRVSVPLSLGAVEPVDASGFRGVRFDARGEGSYSLIVPTFGARGSTFYRARFEAKGKWKTVKVEFSSLERSAGETGPIWTATDLLMLTFEIAREPGEMGWLELDNIRFYK
ncbi:MAG: amidohydrolase family protein [Blastocatellia bacterium]|nr:amidohydrolase family protein [Blastocatellia bacterium]